MAMYNMIFKELIDRCPTDEDFEIEFEDYVYIHGKTFFRNNHSLSCNEIGEPDKFENAPEDWGTDPTAVPQSNWYRTDIAEMNKLLSRKQINEDQREIYNKIVDKFFNPNEVLKKSVSDLLERHEIDPSKILFTYFRGTDGAYERPSGSIPFWTYIPFIRKFIESGGDTIIIQSDSGNFYFYIMGWLWKKYPHIRVVIFDEINLPNTTWKFQSEKTTSENFYGDCHSERVKKQPVFVNEPQTHTEHMFSGFYENSEQFSLLWTSMALIASKCEFYIGNKSNLSVFTGLYRKNNHNFANLDASLKFEFESDFLTMEEWKDDKEIKESRPQEPRDIWYTE